MGRSIKAAAYSAPALEKGLDILELLADDAGDGKSLAEIARTLSRSNSEIFRMLACLCQRGYLRRDAVSETYQLTSLLFALSHRHPPTRRLIESALPVMRKLAEATGQSCHLAVLHGSQILVAAQMDSPRPYSFAVRLGSRIPAGDTTSGRILAAFGSEGNGTARAAELAAIRRAGFARMPSRQVAGVVDLAFPVFDAHGAAVAALCVPCLTFLGQGGDEKEVLQCLRKAAATITAALGGEKSAEKKR